MTPKISIIICSIEAGKFARVCECYKRLLAGHPHEIIGIHDARSLAEAYNRGIQQASGEIIIFSHDDLLILDPDFAPKIVARMQDFDLLGFAGTSRLIDDKWGSAGHPHLHGVISHARPGQTHLSIDVYGVTEWPVVGNIKALDGVCMVTTRQAASAVGFDAELFDGFHLYDIDFSFSAHLAGYRLGVCCDIPLIHESAGRFDEQHQKYAARFIEKHAARLDPAPRSAAPASADTPSFLGGCRAARFRETAGLMTAWQPDVLRRCTLAMHRQAELR